MDRFRSGKSAVCPPIRYAGPLLNQRVVVVASRGAVVRQGGAWRVRGMRAEKRLILNTVTFSA